jgi:hypothetical protein
MVFSMAGGDKMDTSMQTVCFIILDTFYPFQVNSVAGGEILVFAARIKVQN